MRIDLNPSTLFLPPSSPQLCHCFFFLRSGAFSFFCLCAGAFFSRNPDECVDVLLILFTAKRKSVFSTLVACNYLSSVGNMSLPESSDERIITTFHRKIPKYGITWVAASTIPSELITLP